jgi:hypothetical protein
MAVAQSAASILLFFIFFRISCYWPQSQGVISANMYFAIKSN